MNKPKPPIPPILPIVKAVKVVEKIKKVTVPAVKKVTIGNPKKLPKLQDLSKEYARLKKLGLD